MTYDILVQGFNPDIEEEILIKVDSIEIICFVTYWKSNIEIGKRYTANINMTIFDDLEIKEKKEQDKGFLQIDNTFAYFINGKFDFESRSIDAGILISFDEDEDIHDFAYLDGKNIEIRVNRITLEFID